MIRFEFSNLHTDPPVLSHPHDAVLGVVGNFVIVVRDKILYSEVDFPLVEFARELKAWLERVGEKQHDFEYDSAEAAEPGLVWVRQEESGWRIGSIAQEYPEMTTFSIPDIRSAHDDFANHLEEGCLRELRLDVSGLLRDAA